MKEIDKKMININIENFYKEMNIKYMKKNNIMIEKEKDKENVKEKKIMNIKKKDINYINIIKTIQIHHYYLQI